MTQRVGILGGTFNPIHYGHLRSAEEVRDRFGLDRVFFVPSATPPLKNDPSIPGAIRRLRMVELAVRGNPNFIASKTEISRGGRSYSVDTIKHFRRRFPEPNAIFFILGLDAFLEIHHWKNYREIFTLCDIVVTSRPGYRSRSHWRSIPIEIQNEFRYDRRKEMCVHCSERHVHFVDITGLEISASAIRDKIKKHKSIRYLTPDIVIRFIDSKGLYRTKGKGKV